MTGLNRGRYTAQVDGPWRLYTSVYPAGWQMIGTIQRGMEIGALIKSPVGLYCQLNAGAIRLLNQHKVDAAIDAYKLSCK